MTHSLWLAFVHILAARWLLYALGHIEMQEVSVWIGVAVMALCIGGAGFYIWKSVARLYEFATRPI